MKTRNAISTLCLLALALAGCATTEATTEAPAAAEGAPATAEPTTGGEAAPAAASAPAPAAEAAPAAAPAPVAAAEPAPAANTAQPSAAPAVTPVGVLITHKVKDFDAWKKAFDGHQDGRKAGSAVGHGLMRDAKDDKVVSIWLPATDAEKMKAFGESKELKDKMKEAGVVGKPTVITMKPSEMLLSRKPGLAAAFVQVKVKDFAAFKTALDASAQARTDAGLVGLGLAQDIANDKAVYFYLQSEDLAKLQAYVGSKDTKKAWKDAGVIGAAKVSYMKETESAMYQ